MGKSRTGRSRGTGHAARAPEVIRLLTRAGSGGLTKNQIVAELGTTSPVSIQRTLNTLRRDRDAQIEYVLATRCWRLVTPFTMPLEAPEEDDVDAVLLAVEIATPLVEGDVVERIRRVAEQLDEKRIARSGGSAGAVAARVNATLTLGTRVKVGVLRTLQQACRRAAVRIDYESPWKPVGLGRRWYEIEPWALRFHDGAAYLRAWRRDIGEPRTLRVAQIKAIERFQPPKTQRLARVPPPAALWDDGDPAFGIDHDRPGEAVVVLEGAVARWVHSVDWHPTQTDRWVVEGEVLERRLRFRSCRELARRIASVYDAAVSIEPEALRDEVARIVRGNSAPQLPGVMQRVPADGGEQEPAHRPAADE